MAMSVVYTTINGMIVHENRGGVESFYAPDTMGSTVALLNSSGLVTDTYTYWPYGEIRSHVGSSQTPFTFLGMIGYYTDVVGNFIYVRARYLRQALTRWQTVDLLWPLESQYCYARCAPTLISDPSGLRPPFPVGTNCAAWLRYIRAMIARCRALHGNNSVCIASAYNLFCAYSMQCLHKTCLQITSSSGVGTVIGGNGGGPGSGSSNPQRPQKCQFSNSCPDTPACNKLCTMYRAGTYPHSWPCLDCCIDSCVGKPRDCKLACMTICDENFGLSGGWGIPGGLVPPCDCG